MAIMAGFPEEEAKPSASGVVVGGGGGRWEWPAAAAQLMIIITKYAKTNNSRIVTSYVWKTILQKKSLKQSRREYAVWPMQVQIVELKVKIKIVPDIHDLGREQAWVDSNKKVVTKWRKLIIINY